MDEDKLKQMQVEYRLLRKMVSLGLDLLGVPLAYEFDLLHRRLLPKERLEAIGIDEWAK